MEPPAARSDHHRHEPPTPESFGRLRTGSAPRGGEGVPAAVGSTPSATAGGTPAATGETPAPTGNVSRRLPERAVDAAVIGGGLAGSAAAFALARAGYSVLLCRTGFGATGLGSGALNLADPPVGPDRAPRGFATDVDRNARALMALRPGHPYRLLPWEDTGAADPGAHAPGGPGAADAPPPAPDFSLCGFLRTHGSELLAALADAGFSWRGPFAVNTVTVTTFGTLHAAAALPASVPCWDRAGLASARVAFVGFDGHQDFRPTAAAAVFDAQRAAWAAEGPPSIARAVPLPAGLPAWAATTMRLARWLETAAGREALIAPLLAAAPTAASVIVAPPLFGVRDHRARWAALIAREPRLAEALPVLHALTGLRLAAALDDVLAAAGVEVREGQARAPVIADGRLLQFAVGEEWRVRARRTVIATGRFLGGGLGRGRYFECGPLALPLFLPDGPVGARHPTELAPREAAPWGQPWARLGVRADRWFRPRDERGRPCFENVHAAGALLADSDPAQDGDGLGVALCTGLGAGLRVAELLAAEAPVGCAGGGR